MSLDFALPTSRLHAIRSGAVLVPDSPAIFRIEGTGALTCLQGLLTNDLAAPGAGSLVYGAVRMPKGMILFDAWVLREEDAFTLVTGAPVRTGAADLFRRSLPPRLARVTDLSDSHRAAWLLGSAAPERMARVLDLPIPSHGKAVRGGAGDTMLIAGATPAAPFTALALAPADAMKRLEDEFSGGRAVLGDARDLAAAAILAGWPSLGREIDEKTLPQEARYDEIGGVSYTKGCYTGQETVARIHFRGHVNRSLRGLVFEGAEPLASRSLMLAGKDVGQVKSAVSLDDRVLALGMIRREVESHAVISAGDRTATLSPLPFEL